jgi:glutamate--cysteine ligase
MPFEAWRQQYVSADRLGLSHTAVAPALAAV